MDALDSTDINNIKDKLLIYEIFKGDETLMITIKNVQIGY